MEAPRGTRQGAGPADPPALRAGPELAGAHCSICQSGVVAGELVARCPSCGVTHHADCWRENGGCSQYGCASAPATEKAPPTGGDDAGEGWDVDKLCPACGRQIKGRAVRCRHCGESFGTRQAMTHDQYAGRAYAGPEYATRRNQVLGLFLLSATGCLAPLALTLSAILVWHGRLGSLVFRRLPPVLKGLALCSLAVNCVLILLLVFALVLD